MFKEKRCAIVAHPYSYSGIKKFTTSCSTVILYEPTGVFIMRPSMPTMAFLAYSTSISLVR